VIIFLDIDGVIHPIATSFIPEPFTSVARLESILIDFPDCRIVISSGLREQYTLNCLKKLFSVEIAAHVIDVTPVIQLAIPFRRQCEIEQYLAKSMVTSCDRIALDDDARHFYKNHPNLILCSPMTGLNESVEKKIRTKLSSSNQNITNRCQVIGNTNNHRNRISI
jgi:hypothetical protein